jgi:hypothetical protein
MDLTAIQHDRRDLGAEYITRSQQTMKSNWRVIKINNSQR